MLGGPRLLVLAWVMPTLRTTSVRAAGIYCRISSDPSGARLGVTRQLTDCQRLADRLGWPVHERYIDNDTSAYSGARRPGYERLLTDIATGTVDAVLTWHLDRLNRSQLELERLIGLLDTHRVTIQTVTAGVLDLATPSGRAVARTLGAWARYESEHKSERIRAQKHQNALRGAPNGGAQRPYGYAADKVTIVPAEADVVREAMRRFLAGTPTAVICRDLNARGIPTTGSHAWLSSYLDRILTSPRIAGWRQAPQHRPARGPAEFLARAQWPPIVTRGSVERAQALMADPTLRPGSSYRRLLTGIAVCSICGQPLRLVQHTGHPARYACQPGSSGLNLRCGHVSTSADFADEYVLDQICDALGAGLLDRPRCSAPMPAATSTERPQDTGLLSTPGLLELAARIAVDGNARAAFTAGSIADQRNWIGALTEAISVSPSTRRTRVPDPGRIRVTWSPALSRCFTVGLAPASDSRTPAAPEKLGS